MRLNSEAAGGAARSWPALSPVLPLLFARHGATAPNLAGLRCGGDLDPPLTDTGREQAVALARVVAQRQRPVDLIICSDLQRTRETAAIVRAALGPVELRVNACWRERLLGGWNLQPLADTEAALAAGDTPPGGESRETFARRIGQAMLALAPLLAGPQPRQVLLVGSKGVGRVLREHTGLPPAAPLANAELAELQLHGLMPAPPAESLA